MGSKRFQEDPGLFSLRFTGWWDTASLGSWGEGMGGVVEFFRICAFYQSIHDFNC
jgi:hypothetical protein